MSPLASLRPQVARFLAQKPIPLFVAGRWAPGSTGRTLEVRDPGDGTEIARVSAGEAADIDAAVAAAENAFRTSGWPQLPANDRAALIHRLADLVERDRDILAQIESLDVGKPLAAAQGIDIPNVAQTLRYFADLSVHTRRREPIAVPQTPIR